MKRKKEAGTEVKNSINGRRRYIKKLIHYTLIGVEGRLLGEQHE